MTVTGKMFGSCIVKAFNKEIDFDTDAVKVMLCTNLYTPNQETHAYKSDVTNEVVGTGYIARGQALASKAIAFFGPNTSTAWAASTAYALGDVRRPTAANGHVYVCTVAGTSGAAAPAWPTASGGTVVDGGVTWTEAGANLLRLDAADTTWAASTITARYAVIYEDTGTDTTSALFGYLDFGVDSVSSSGNFTITWAAFGLFYFNI